MEQQQITNLLGTTIDEVPRFITKKWVEVHGHSGSADDRYKPNKQIRFKTSILRFTKFISKINNVLIDNAEDIDIVMPMYNLFEYSKNYKKNRKFLELLQR